MGFLGSIRRIVLKTFKDGAYDLSKASEDLVREARHAVNTADISAFFSTKYLRDVNRVPHLGEQELFKFVRFSREGDFAKSFGASFPTHASLNNPSVRVAVNNLLLDARRTLPDFQIARDNELLLLAKRNTGLDTKAVLTASDLEKAISANKQLEKTSQSFLKRVLRSRQIKLFGSAVVLSAGVVTTTSVYQALEKAAADNSGCFAYWNDTSGNVKKCKISAYSCKYPKDGNTCTAGIISSNVLQNVDCMNVDNRGKNCIHCSSDDPLNADLPDTVSLLCEEKTVGDIFLEAINNTMGNVWTGVTGALSNILMWGAIVLVVIIVFVVLINFLR